MGQVVTENYLLIHTESKHFPLIPQTEQVQSSTSNNGLFPEDKKQLLPVDWGGGGGSLFLQNLLSQKEVYSSSFLLSDSLFILSLSWLLILS